MSLIDKFYFPTENPIFKFHDNCIRLKFYFFSNLSSSFHNLLLFYLLPSVDTRRLSRDIIFFTLNNL